MSEQPRRDPQLLVRIGVALSLFNSWVLFEETVVDRLGWWRHMPCYKVGRFCEWDVGAILLILAISILGFSDTRSSVRAFFQRWCTLLGCRLCAAG